MNDFQYAIHVAKTAGLRVWLRGVIATVMVTVTVIIIAVFS